MTAKAGRRAFPEILQAAGATHISGSPGTTELPLMHIFVDYPDIHDMLTLQQGVAMAMADGYAFSEPILWGDLVRLVESMTKWAYQIERVEDLPPALHRARHNTTHRPGVSIPSDGYHDGGSQPQRHPATSSRPPHPWGFGTHAAPRSHPNRGAAGSGLSSNLREAL